MKRVFVSSTFVDLEPHRNATRAAIRQLGAVDVAMEDFGARDERPKAECLRLVREGSDVFVGVYAHRYGSIPPGDERSITQQEYDAARRAKLPIFAYLVDPAYDWPKKVVDTGEAANRLKAFTDAVKSERIIGRFTTPDSLAAEVAADLGRHFSTEAEARPVETHGIIHQPPPEWVSAASDNPWRYKVIAFDLDGTLLRGTSFEFSWEAIWTGLKFSPRIQGDLKRDYRRRSGGGASRKERIAAYQDWCDKACEHFRARGLTREKLRDLAGPTKLTRNGRAALKRLRKEGMSLAIVSGGVDTFLEDRFPDFRDFVDFAFVNELTFAGDGKLEGVLATAYDFEGKAEALQFLICERVGCAPSEAVVVGDHFNDEAIMLRAGLAIAYPSHDVVVDGASQVAIDKDDLLAILPHVLVA